MAANPVNERWQASMAEYFDNGDQNPDSGIRPLPEYFHLD
jgi:L-rhamnose mutarotase